MLSANTDEEQGRNESRIKEIDKIPQTTNRSTKDINASADEIRQLAKITELMDDLVDRLIKEIDIGKLAEEDGKRTQEIVIKYAFVGNISDKSVMEFSNGNHKKTLVKVVSGDH